MLGQLPKALDVNGMSRVIRPSYTNILRIISAYGDNTLRDNEKSLICLKRMYLDFSSIPQTDYGAAYEAASTFIECKIRSDRPSPKLIDWEKDEQMIFSAVNKVAGREVRELPDMHWWTFLGYFQSIDPESLWGYVLTIRQKRARHRKLEKHEQEFYNANRAMCELVTPKDRKKETQDYAEALYQELISEQRRG